MSNTILAFIGIAGGIICAIADLFLDLKGPDNKKMGKLKVIDSKWATMPHYRFVTSTILATFAVPMYCCGMWALSLNMQSETFALIFRIVALVGAMGGFMIHTFLNICPTIYQLILKKDKFELAEEVIDTIFKQIYFPFFACYTLLVIVTSGMVIFAIIAGIIPAPMWCLVLNPVVFQIVGLLFRATKLKCFIDAPSCCAASLGLASFGLLALIIM